MKKWMCLICFISLFSCSPENTEIKFDMKGCIFIPVTIKGKMHHFVFDTGASMTRLSASLIKELNVTATDSIPIKILIQKVVATCPIYAPISFGIGNLSAKSTFCTTPEADLNIMGMDIISQFHWHFDFKTSGVKISKKEMNVDPLDSIRTVFHYENDPVMIVPVTFNDSIRYNFRFDTGIPKSGTNEEFIFYTTEYPESLEFNLMQKSGGLSGYYRENLRFSVFLSLKINGVKYPYSSFLFDTDSKNKAIKNFYIGMPFISGRYRILNINPDKQEIILAKKQGECMEHEEYQKNKFDESAERYKAEQKREK